MNLFNPFLIFLLIVTSAQAQFTVKGHFNGVANTPVMLRGYGSPMQEVKFAESLTDQYGHFSLQYPENYVGAAVLEIRNGKQLIVLLNHENFEIKWKDIDLFSSLEFINSPENTAFDEGLNVYRNTSEKKAGISYLLPYYADDVQKTEFFTTELRQLHTALPDHLNKLPVDSYALYYLKIRILIADLQLSSKRNYETLAALHNQFKQIDFGDTRLIQSGIYKELLQTYFSTVENYEQQKELLIRESLDRMFTSLKANPLLKQEVAAFLFQFFEQRSMFDAASSVAISLLEDPTLILDDKRQALFEQYRKVAIGKTAPDIAFNLSKFTIKQLSQIKKKYQLVVFGASWCPACVAEIPKLKAMYANWKTQYDLEIAFISLDTDKEDFLAFSKDFPWISSCDLNGWESKPVKDYYVFATPTMFLLDANQKILLKPSSIDQLNAWLDYHN